MPQASAAGVTNLTVQTVASYGHAPHPDWVSYLVKNEQGQWVHSTIWKVPANSTVRMTVLQYDGDSGLRNPFLGLPRGIVGEHDDDQREAARRCSTPPTPRTRSRSPTSA